MLFNPKFSITTKINSSLVEIERVRGEKRPIRKKGREERNLLYLSSFVADKIRDIKGHR